MALVLCAGHPGAQETARDIGPEILGKDDEVFARNLSRLGYPDLAEIVLAAIGRSGGGAGASSVRAAMLRLEFEQDKAQREPDTGKRIGLLEGLIRSREEFARTHAGTPEANEVLAGQQELYRAVGELITRALQETPPPSDADALRKRGIEILEQAVAALEARDEELAKPLESPTPEQEEALYLDRMITSYGLARTLYFRALLYEEGSFERTVIARKALKILLDFQLEYSDQLLCYEGYIYEGLCHEALGENEKALESFDAAIALRDTYERTRAGVYQMAPDAADIVSSAVQQKMILLAKTGDHAGAAAVAADFIATTSEPWTALKGLAVYSLQADAYQALGDQKALMEVAKTLIEVDPFGAGGYRGRELLGGGGGASALGAVEIMKLAESNAVREPDKAIQLCQRVMILARGTSDEDGLGARAGNLLGALYAQRGLLHEAVIAWETSAQRYPDGKDAPECLWKAINGYLSLQGQERRTLYKTLAQERLAELLSLYPEHEYAAKAGLIEGRQAEEEQDFLRAAAVYERLAPGSAGYEEGLYRAGNAWQSQARKLFQEGKAQEAQEAVKRAEALLVKARAELEAAAGKTLETAVQDRMRALAFSARIALANLYLMPRVERSGEVAKLLQGLDQELASDPARMSMVWDLRFRSLRAQNKLDEAIALLDAQIRQDPGASWLEAGASALAPILDARGQELAKTGSSSVEADRLWGKAATYYQLAIKGQLEGRSAVQVEQLEDVADRLLLFALRFEGVPDTVETFADWGGKRLSSELLDRAVQAYETVLPLTPSHRTVIKLARTLGFLHRWEEAAARYAELFERERFVDRLTNTINQEAVAAKPELLFAYIEYGVAEREVGLAANDQTKLQRAQKIFEALVLGTVKDSKTWWQANYRQVQTMIDRGQYEVADISLKSLELHYPSFDGGRYGLEPRFRDLKGSLAGRVFSTPGTRGGGGDGERPK